MKDPVTDFEYPGAWVAACRSPDLLPDVRRGLAVLTASGTVLRRGFTTGTTAAAACKAAVLSLAEDEVKGVGIALPCGISVRVPVDAYRGTASCWKDAGDYPADVTAGLEFVATAVPSLSGSVQFVPGEGIGSFAATPPVIVRGRRPSAPRRSTASGGRSTRRWRKRGSTGRRSSSRFLEGRRWRRRR